MGEMMLTVRRSFARKMGALSSLAFLLLFNTSCSTLGDIASEGGWHPTSLACKAADRALTAPRADENFVKSPLLDDAIDAYVKRVRLELDPYARLKGTPITVWKTARVQGESFHDDAGNRGIFITRGMLNMMEDEAELACLIGHEMGHADMGHKYLAQNDGTVGRLVGKGLDEAGKRRPGSAVIGEAQGHRHDILLAQRCQADEQAADEYGAVLAAKADYDPYAFCRLFDRLARKVDMDLTYRVGKLTSTHKALDTRAAHLREFLRAKGYREGNGFHRRDEFRSGMAHLALYHTGEGAEAGKGGSLERSHDDLTDIRDLAALRDELRGYHKRGEKLSQKRFRAMMDRYAKYVRRHHVTRESLAAALCGDDAEGAPKRKGPGSFMVETIYQDIVYVAPTGSALGPAGTQLLEGLRLVPDVLPGEDEEDCLHFIKAYEDWADEDFFDGV